MLERNEILWVTIDEDENTTVEKIVANSNYTKPYAKLIEDANSRKMSDERDMEEFSLIKIDHDDEIETEYSVKLGEFSWDYKDLYETFNSMKELYDYMKEFTLCENNDVIYTAYVEEKRVVNEEIARANRRDYERDMRAAYYN